MKMLKFCTLILLSVFLLGAAGCRTAPIYNVNDAPIVVTSRNYNMTDIRNAILRAGASLGWQMRETEPGLIVGVLNLRNGRAEITVRYDKDNYAVTYKDSSNLSYDGSQIHEDYNIWIQRLDAAIRNQLLTV